MRKRVFCLIMLLIMATTLLCACNTHTDTNGDNFPSIDSDNIIATQSGEVLNKRYTTEKHSTSTESDFIGAYSDDNYCYYYYKLGRVYDVPLQSKLEVPYWHYTGNNYTKAFKTTKTTTESVEDACTTAVTNTTTFSSTDNIKTGLSVKVTTSAEAKLTDGIATATLKETAEFASSVEAGYSSTTGKNNTSSRTDSYKQVATNSETTEETTGFEFTSDSKVGYYRYIMTGTVDVYTVVIYSTVNDTYYLKTLTEVTSYGFSFDYSKSPEFDDNLCGNLNFDCSILNDLSETAGGATPPQIGGDTAHYAGGYGTTAQPYLIESIEQFSNIRLYPSAVFSIVKDIDANGYTLQPIPDFAGELQGGKHAIYNFNIVESGTASEINVGLFRKNSGKIKDLTIGKSGVTKYDNKYSVKYDIQCTETYNKSYLMVGGFVGKNQGTVDGCKLVNVYVNASFADKNNNENLFLYAGGIIGYNYSNGNITDCHVETSFFDVEATTVVDSGDDNYGYVGGLCGENHATIARSSVRGATLTLVVRGDGKNNNKAYPHGYLGGLVGSQCNGTVTECEIGGNTLSIYGSSGGYTKPTVNQGDYFGRNVGGTVQI